MNQYNNKKYQHDYYLRRKEYYKKIHHAYYIAHTIDIINRTHTNYFKNIERNKQQRHLYYLNHKKYNHQNTINWRTKNHERTNELSRNWRKQNPNKTKIISAKSRNKRKRELEFNLISENIIDEKIQYHHIDNFHVAPIPEDLHILYNSPNRLYHRFMCNQIMKQIYGEK